ncbi:MAG: GNAT family N-acetyltransferase [Gammaproteobacteria bacterium]|jgi:acetyltransferase|nr:GNAT family N-acetyltransferase [Gammaproteobacteria bacterium]
MAKNTRWPVKEHLLDGRPVIIRPLGADDREALVTGYQELSSHSVYMRFLGYKSGLSESELDHLTHQHPEEHLTLGIEVKEEGESRGIGIARYQLVEGSQPAIAEFGVVVVDRYHGLGGGTLLLKHLCKEARQNGICCLRGETLATNLPVLAVLKSFNPRFEPGNDEDTLMVFIPLQEQQE